MDIKKKQRPLVKKPVFWVVLVIALALLFLILEKAGVTNLINTSAPAGPTPAQLKEETEAAAEKKKDLIKEDTKADPYNAADPNDAERSISISAKQEGNGTVTVFTKLYGYSGGSCKVEISNGTKTTSQTAEAMYQPEYASCAGFSVPIEPLGSGSWTIKLSVTSGGSTKDKTIVFEVK